MSTVHKLGVISEYPTNKNGIKLFGKGYGGKLL